MAHANRGQRDGGGKTNLTLDLDPRYLSGTLDGGDEFRWSVAALGDHVGSGNGNVRLSVRSSARSPLESASTSSTNSSPNDRSIAL